MILFSTSKRWVKETNPGDSFVKHVTLTIEEGCQYLVSNIKIKGNKAVSEDVIYKSILTTLPGFGSDGVYVSKILDEDINVIQIVYLKEGFTKTRVKKYVRILDAPDPKKTKQKNVEIELVIDEGIQTKVSGVQFKGLSALNRNEALDLISLRPGEPFREYMMDINALDSARFRTIGLNDNKGNVDIIVEVEEKKPWFFELGTGYDTERHLYLNSIVGDHNLWGENLDLQLEAEVSQIGYKGNISLINQRFLSTQIDANTRIFGEKREAFNTDFGTRTYGVTQNFFQRFFSRKLMANLGFTYKSREQYLTKYRELTQEEKLEYEPRQIFTASPGLIYQTTDSYVRPRKGSLSSFNVDISKGIDNSLDDFIKYRLDTRYYYTLVDPLVIALRGQYGYIQPYGGNSRVPGDQLFFLGGTSSVRGFDENLLRFDAAGKSVGGREVILGTVEARYDLGLNIELAAFYDTGAVRNAQGRAGSDAFRDSVGLGLRYMTPIGPIGFLYGWKLDAEPNESPGSLHFSMGYTF